MCTSSSALQPVFVVTRSRFGSVLSFRLIRLVFEGRNHTTPSVDDVGVRRIVWEGWCYSISTDQTGMVAAPR